MKYTKALMGLKAYKKLLDLAITSITRNPYRIIKAIEILAEELKPISSVISHVERKELPKNVEGYVIYFVPENSVAYAFLIRDQIAAKLPLGPLVDIAFDLINMFSNSLYSKEVGGKEISPHLLGEAIESISKVRDAIYSISSRRVLQDSTLREISIVVTGKISYIIAKGAAYFGREDKEKIADSIKLLSQLIDTILEIDRKLITNLILSKKSGVA